MSRPATKSFAGLVGSTAPVRSYHPWPEQKFVVAPAVQITVAAESSVVLKIPSEENCPLGQVVPPLVTQAMSA